MTTFEPDRERFSENANPPDGLTLEVTEDPPPVGHLLGPKGEVVRVVRRPKQPFGYSPTA
jgi:hypothetical protein